MNRIPFGANGLRLMCAVAAVALASVGALCQGKPPPASMVVVYAKDDDESLSLARHYAAVRGIPDANLIPIDSPASEEIPRAEFTERIWNPLVRELYKRGLVKGLCLSESSLDREGRQLAQPRSHSISWLVVCKGVSLRVAGDASLKGAAHGAQLPVQFRVDHASVDAELPFIVMGDQPPLLGPIPNPWMCKDSPDVVQGRGLVKVSRLDGPTYADARRLVDDAVAVEKRGLAGTCAIDIGGPVGDGDRWLDGAAGHFRGKGFPMLLERSPALFSEADRFDHPAIYMGWYAQDVGGVFNRPGFRFPQGAIAIHLHSFSAASMRDPSKWWASPLVARGAAATVGNVYEPYLAGTHNLDVLAERLCRGWSWGDAAWAALPYVSWQAVLIGDPLYEPFRRPIAEMVADASHPGRTYARVRQARLLELTGKSAEAVSLLVGDGSATPDLPTLCELARMGSAAPAPARMNDWSRQLAGSEWRPTPDQWGMCLELARSLEVRDGYEASFLLVQRLLDVGELPRTVRIAALREGTRLGARLGNPRTKAWQEELRSLDSAKVSGANGKP